MSDANSQQKVRVVHGHTCDPVDRCAGLFLDTYGDGLRHVLRDRVGRKWSYGWRWVPVKCNADADCKFEAIVSVEWLTGEIEIALEDNDE